MPDKDNTVYFGGRLDKEKHNQFKVKLFKNGLKQQEFIEKVVELYINDKLDLNIDEEL